MNDILSTGLDYISKNLIKIFILIVSGLAIKYVINHENTRITGFIVVVVLLSVFVFNGEKVLPALGNWIAAVFGVGGAN